MRLTTSDLVVLSVYLYDGPMHGYELIKRLEASNVSEWAAVSKPQVYYSLRKLVKSGHLSTSADREPAQGPERTVYKPTRKAEADMKRQLAENIWAETRVPAPFVTWTALALHADNSTIKSQMQCRRDYLLGEIENENETLALLEKQGGQNTLVAKAMIRIVIGQMNAEMSELDSLETALLRKTPR